MKYAIVEGERQTAIPHVRGTCQVCKGETVAKCGQFKQWHWAHKTKVSCDHWWETETEWHRNWKNQFPETWQEIIHKDLTIGEKHVADVKTADGRVVEFQHSLLKKEEIDKREQFYAEMIWIVDGLRNPNDDFHFHFESESFSCDTPNIRKFKWLGRSKLFERWSDSSKPVFVDFGTPFVWHLDYYNCLDKKGAVTPVLKHTLINDLINGKSIEFPVLGPQAITELLEEPSESAKARPGSPRKSTVDDPSQLKLFSFE